MRVPWAVLFLFLSISSVHAMDEQLTVLQVAESIIQPNMDDSDKGIIEHALQGVPAEKLTYHFKNVVLSLITPDMKGLHCATIVWALTRLSKDKWDEFKDLSLLFIPADTDGKTRSWIFESLGKVSSDQWEKFKVVAFYFITPEMTGFDQACIVDALSQITVEKVTEDFKRVVFSFLKKGMKGSDCSKILHAVADVPPEKLTEEFEKNVHSVTTSDMNAENHATIIKAFGKVSVHKWKKFKTILSALMLPNINGQQLARLISALGTLSPEKLKHKFKEIALSFMPETMDTENRARLIFAFVDILNENISEEFKVTVLPEISDDMDGIQRGIIIRAFGKLKAEKWEELKKMAHSFFTPKMNGKNRVKIFGFFGDLSDKKWNQFKENGLSLISEDMYDDDRVAALQTLKRIPEELWNEFTLTAQSLMTKEMIGTNRSVIIKELGDILPFKRVQVYSQVRRFTQSVKFNFTNCNISRYVIKSVAWMDPIERAQVYITGLIRLVQTDPQEVDNLRLLDHIQTMRARVEGIDQQDLADLVRDAQSLHKKEVHESVAVSLERLKERYPTALSLSENVYDLILDELTKFIPKDPGRVLNATRLFKDTYKDPDIHTQVDVLLTLNPYTKSGDGDADTFLNESVVAFLEPYKKKDDDISKKFVKDVQNLISLYAHQDDLGNAAEVLEFMESTPNYRDPLSFFNYYEMLCFVYHAITDPLSSVSSKSLSPEDIQGRWANFIYRLAQAHHEYGDEAGCLSGIFNASLDALNRVHPDVTIIHSFSIMMQEIGGESDDETFEKRVALILSYLGPHAQEDSYYQDVIKAYRSARAARKDEDEEI